MNTTSSYDLLVDEEAQVVPSSLDHLSRHELCHMIFRLDYERNALKEKLVALQLAVSSSNSNNVALGPGGSVGHLENGTPSQFAPPNPAKKRVCSNDEREVVAKKQKRDGCNGPLEQKEEPSPAEINDIHRCLVQSVIAGIKATTHGGLRKPRTTAEKNGISINTAIYIMQDWGEKITHDTKRMTKWEFKYDDDIVKFLKCGEKYLSGVRHNGKGFLVRSGTLCLQYAKFELMIVSYDKLTMTMKVQVCTRGCTKNGK